MKCFLLSMESKRKKAGRILEALSGAALLEHTV